jgi:hypothetical protein
MSSILLPTKKGDLGQYFKDGSFIPWDEWDFEQEYYLDLSQDFPKKGPTPDQSYRNQLIENGYSPLGLLSSQEDDEMLEKEEQAETAKAKAAGPHPQQRSNRQKTVGVPADKPSGDVPKFRPDVRRKPDHLRCPGSTSQRELGSGSCGWGTYNGRRGEILLRSHYC